LVANGKATQREEHTHEASLWGGGVTPALVDGIGFYRVAPVAISSTRLLTRFTPHEGGFGNDR